MKPRFLPTAVVLVLTLGVLPLGGCKSKSSTPQGTTYVYHLKGIVKGLPVPLQGPPSLMIKMPAIPDWVGITGKITPMMAMTMPCQLAKHVSIVGLNLGDKVAFTYKVNWQRDRMVITRIQKLPADTVLHF